MILHDLFNAVKKILNKISFHRHFNLLGTLWLYHHVKRNLNGNKNFYRLAHLKETPKLYIEVYYRIFISALFRDIFICHLGHL